jgi:hypothetical protein
MARERNKDRWFLRRLIPILVMGIFAFAGAAAQTKTSVPGMSRFTDSNFGFSFWYPTAWKVIDEPVADPTEHGWFPNAKIVRELQIRNPAASDDNDQPPGVILQELSAPAGLTELGHSKSASPVGIDQRYFFDGRTHQWMYAQLSEAPDGAPPQTYPAEIPKRTVGGLPIFSGAMRHGADLIVPLDGSHFLVISTMDIGGYNSHLYLAATVVSTNPRVGKRASDLAQAESIRREGIKLGVIGEFLGFWYKDSSHVYDFEGEVIPGADPKTFAPLSRSGPNASFASDGKQVYSQDGTVIPGADSKSFVAISQWTAKDAHHTYDWSSGNLKIGSVK